jgi:hypothetical protein
MKHYFLFIFKDASSSDGLPVFCSTGGSSVQRAKEILEQKPRQRSAVWGKNQQKPAGLSEPAGSESTS